MIACLQQLGITIHVQNTTITVSENSESIKNKEYLLDCHASGTTMRFLLSLCSIIPGTKILTGTESLLKRPIGDLVDALKKLGADITYINKKGYPPLKVRPAKKIQKIISIKGNISSQYLSGLLMVSPLIGDITINVTGALISKPYIDMTLATMKSFGMEVINNNYSSFIIPKQQYQASNFTVEGDVSSACYFAAIAALTQSTITLKNIYSDSRQGDMQFFSILKSMGNIIKKEKDNITIIGKGVKTVNVDMTTCPDQAQTLAVLAAFAKGKTTITGVASLRVKETERVKATQNELKKMGIKTTATKDILTIYGGNPKPAIIDTYQDHRMAMAFAVAGTKLSGVQINNPDVVTKTFPTFWEILKTIGVGIQTKTPDKLVLIGFMGSGKTSVAPLLAKKLSKTVVEMDDEIMKKSKRKTVQEIFAKDGEPAFRKKELLVAKSLENKDNVVISAGGGVVMNEKPMTYLGQNALIIFLQTSFETLKQRVGHMTDRPLWKNEQKTKELYNIRLPLYKRYADIIVETDGKSLGQVTNEIIEKIENL